MRRPSTARRRQVRICRPGCKKLRGFYKENLQGQLREDLYKRGGQQEQDLHIVDKPNLAGEAISKLGPFYKANLPVWFTRQPHQPDGLETADRAEWGTTRIMHPIPTNLSS